MIIQKPSNGTDTSMVAKSDPVPYARLTKNGANASSMRGLTRGASFMVVSRHESSKRKLRERPIFFFYILFNSIGAVAAAVMLATFFASVANDGKTLPASVATAPPMEMPECGFDGSLCTSSPTLSQFATQSPTPPTQGPSKFPTFPVPTKSPTTDAPTPPTSAPTTRSPTTRGPTKLPTQKPTASPTPPTKSPTKNPTRSPTQKPTTQSPTQKPTTRSPTRSPTEPAPTKLPTPPPNEGRRRLEAIAPNSIQAIFESDYAALSLLGLIFMVGVAMVAARR